MPGKGKCQTATGSEGTAHRFVYHSTVDQVQEMCNSDSQCVAFVFASDYARGIVYSPDKCEFECTNLSWQSNPSLIVKAGNTPYNYQWKDGTCYRKNGFKGK